MDWTGLARDPLSGVEPDYLHRNWSLHGLPKEPTDLHCTTEKSLNSISCIVQILTILFLPPANEVWGKVICLQACVCPRGSVWSWGGVWSRGVHGPGGVHGPRGQGCGVCMVTGGACSLVGGCWDWSRGVCMVRGGVHSPGGSGGDLPPTATAAGGTHPTGMHSCFQYFAVFYMYGLYCILI